MTELQRIKKVCKWLIFNDFAENDKELADKLGYTKSSFSQILNGKVPISGKFIDKLCDLDKNINKVWVLSEKGEMFKEKLIKEDNSYLIELQKETIELLKDKIERLEDENREKSIQIAKLEYMQDFGNSNPKITDNPDGPIFIKPKELK